VSNNKDQLSWAELLEYKKECLLEELKFRVEGLRRRSVHKWQLRVLFIVLSASFLGLCFSSKDFRAFPISVYEQYLSTFVLFLIVYIYDSHLGSLAKSTYKRIKSVSKMLNELPDQEIERLKEVKISMEIRLELSFTDRLKQRLSQIKELDYLAFYSLSVSMWVIGWWVRTIGT